MMCVVCFVKLCHAPFPTNSLLVAQKEIWSQLMCQLPHDLCLWLSHTPLLSQDAFLTCFSVATVTIHKYLAYAPAATMNFQEQTENQL